MSGVIDYQEILITFFKKFFPPCSPPPPPPPPPPTPFKSPGSLTWYIYHLSLNYNIHKQTNKQQGNKLEQLQKLDCHVKKERKQDCPHVDHNQSDPLPLYTNILLHLKST